jgi:hypothetical protein
MKTKLFSKSIVCIVSSQSCFGVLFSLCGFIISVFYIKKKMILSIFIAIIPVIIFIETFIWCYVVNPNLNRLPSVLVN